MGNLRGGRQYVVSGASSQTGEDVEITVDAYDEADAARTANRQGVFVSRCVAASADGSTWANATPAAPPAASKLTLAETLARDPVVQRLVRAHPQLAARVKRLNPDDRAVLSALVGEELGISYRDSVYMGKLMSEADQAK